MNVGTFEILKTQGKARRGVFQTAHGTVQTPVFMNVGTAGAIKGAVDAFDLKELGCQVELSNTYHLHVRPGDAIVRQMGGLHKFMRWDIEAMRSGEDDVQRMKMQYDLRRRYLVEELRDMGLDCFEPLGAFYVFPSIRSTGLSSEEFANRLLEDQKVAVVPGNAFGESGEGHVRISYSYSMAHLREAMRRMRVFLEKLKQE